MTGGKTQVIATIEKVQNFNRKQKRDVLTTCQGHWRSKKNLDPEKNAPNSAKWKSRQLHY
jgi:hypothetical protein